MVYFRFVASHLISSLGYTSYNKLINIYFLFHFSRNFSDGNGTAFLRKERLLRFDRDFARRTQIFDDQADYQAPSTWMTEEEKKEAEENQQKHLESLKRPKQVLNLAI